MAKSAKQRDLVVIGGGAGGLVVASVAAQLGLDVVLVEKQAKLGGDCLHHGCVPSKALLRAAHLAHCVKTAGDFGMHNGELHADMARVNARVQDAIASIQQHDSHQRFEALGCEIITGEARFMDPHSISVGDHRLTARRFVIATGSSPLIPPLPGLEQAGFMTNEDVFRLQVLPESLIILGAGPVGVEMAQAFARLGSRVTLVEKAGRILPTFDPDIADALSLALQAEGINIITANPVVAVDAVDGGSRIALQDGTNLGGDALLLALGRRPVVDGLGLELAGVEYSQRGIRVNRRMRTTQRHIYACGDVTGQLPLTHVAEQQAGVVIANAVFRIPKCMDYSVVPSVIYTEPECASVGADVPVGDHDADTEVVSFSMSELDRAIVENRTEGLCKLVVKSGRLIGAHFAGARAGELVHEMALAIQGKMKLSTITGLVHAYPSYSQINRRAGSLFFRKRLFNDRTRKLVRFLNRWIP